MGEVGPRHQRRSRRAGSREDRMSSEEGGGRMETDEFALGGAAEPQGGSGPGTTFERPTPVGSSAGWELREQRRVGAAEPKAAIWPEATARCPVSCHRRAARAGRARCGGPAMKADPGWRRPRPPRGRVAQGWVFPRGYAPGRRARAGRGGRGLGVSRVCAEHSQVRVHAHTHTCTHLHTRTSTRVYDMQARAHSERVPAQGSPLPTAHPLTPSGRRTRGLSPGGACGLSAGAGSLACPPAFLCSGRFSPGFPRGKGPSVSLG